MARRKEKNGEKSPWGQCLTRPVPNGRPHYLPLCLRGWWIALSTFRTSGAWLLVQMVFTELQEIRGSYYSFCLNWHISRAHKRLENRRHFATPPTVSPRNSILMTRYLGSASDWLGQISQSGTTNQKQHPDLGSDASSVRNFFTCFSDVFSRGNRTFINVVWWNRLLSYIFTKRLRCSCCLYDKWYLPI